LKRAGREDLIGDGPECLIPARPSPQARDAKAADKKQRGKEGAARDRDRKKRGGYRWAARKGRRN
jgi:hypothetical protein